MDSIQKFVSDIEKIKKRERAGGSYSGEKAGREVQSLFDRNNKMLGEVSHSISDYWLNTYILASENLSEEPSEKSIQKIAAMQALLDGDDELTGALDKSDWKSLCQIVNVEAEDIPLDSLNSLMSLFVDHQAL